MTKAPPFETLMQDLEKVVAQLETGKLPLEDSFKAYEQGVGLVRQAQSTLKSMEGKIEKLMADGKTENMKVDGVQS